MSRPDLSTQWPNQNLSFLITAPAPPIAARRKSEHRICVCDIEQSRMGIAAVKVRLANVGNAAVSSFNQVQRWDRGEGIGGADEECIEANRAQFERQLERTRDIVGLHVP